MYTILDQDPNATTPEMSDTQSLEPATLTDGIEAERPEHDGRAGDHARPEVTRRRFGKGQAPARLGRFVILDRLGQGGMGLVYSAYDPQLDRRVALKLLRPERDASSSRARARLLREAQALARLSHPNVVPVHDAGMIDDRVFIVMEFVVGETLSAWVEAEPRSWREIVDVYRQAGRGLAAAHAVDIIHRDFKPSNALIGEDGRVRVVDFGLARSVVGADIDTGHDAVSTAGGDGAGASETDPAARTDDPLAPTELADTEHATEQPERVSGDPRGDADSTPPLLDVPLTATGALLGTPAFMSPEQLRGGTVDASSDQFSFCVSLYRALYGQAPFDASARREDGPLGDVVREPPKSRRVPSWVHAIVCRGLQADPSDRHPYMAALADDLGRDPARTRRRWLLALLFVALGGGLSVPLVRALSSQGVEPCRGAERELADVWNSEHRDRVERAIMGTQRPDAEALWPEVRDGLDAYAEAWVQMHQGACTAHQSGRQSGALLDKRMACLERRRLALADAVQVLTEVDEVSVVNALKVVRMLPHIDYCDDTDALDADVPPPEDPVLAARVSALRASLSRIGALEHAGRYEDALALAKAVVPEAEATAYRPLLAESLLAEGRILLLSGELPRSIAPLRRAALLAHAAGADSLALEALARRIFSEGYTAEGLSDALADLPLIEALSERVRHDTFGRALLFNNVGAVHVVGGDPVKGRAYLERALAIRDEDPSKRHVELTAIPLNLAGLTRDRDERIALMRTALDERREALGPTHPFTLQLQLLYSRAFTSPVVARSVIEPACRHYRRLHPQLVLARVNCGYSLAFLDAELADEERAVQGLERVVELARSGPHGVHVTQLGRLAAGYARIFERDYQAALAPLGEALETWREDPDPPWYVLMRMAHAQLAVGISERALGNSRAAIVALESAIAGLEASEEHSASIEHPRRMAWAWTVLAKALWEVNARETTPAAQRERARALTLMSRAHAWYRAAGAGYEWKLELLAAWLRPRQGVADTVTD